MSDRLYTFENRNDCDIVYMAIMPDLFSGEFDEEYEKWVKEYGEASKIAEAKDAKLNEGIGMCDKCKCTCETTMDKELLRQIKLDNDLKEVNIEIAKKQLEDM